MTFDSADIEGVAAELLKRADMDDTEPTKPAALVKRLLGPGSLYSVHARALPGDGALAIVNGQPRIYVRQGLSPVRKRWAICHELAEWWLWRERVRDDGVEHLADSIAAGLIAPHRAYVRALREVGNKYHRLAKWFGTTESCVGLRFGEVTGAPTLLLAPGSVRRRGHEFEWGALCRKQARGGRVCMPIGMTRARLKDDRTRLLLVLSHKYPES